jgi:tetratricopeptide (TPR) repeat protein
VSDNARIEDLRRRVQSDPASIAFGQLAEEYRRTGRFQEAIRVCRTGLEQYPGYLSARVTLGLALIETGLLDDAQRQLEQVVSMAPGNIAAVRALAEIGPRRAVTGEAAGRWDAAVLDIAPPAPEPRANAHSRGSDLETLSAAESRVLGELEAWLAAIVRDRERRRHGFTTLSRPR